jgi:hypothetical protein
MLQFRFMLPQIPWLVYLLPLSLAVLLPSTSQARVGESMADIERRLTSSGGIIYRDQAIIDARMRGMPYLRILDYLPSRPQLRLYFKTDDGRRPMASELSARDMPKGWDLHVIYLNGVSVFEAYKRSQALTEQEINQLLALQQGDSYWERVRTAENTALGYRMLRKDETLRANQVGNDTLIIFDAKMDRRVAEAIEEARIESAPISVQGF